MVENNNINSVQENKTKDSKLLTILLVIIIILLVAVIAILLLKDDKKEANNEVKEDNNIVEKDENKEDTEVELDINSDLVKGLYKKYHLDLDGDITDNFGYSFLDRVTFENFIYNKDNSVLEVKDLKSVDYMSLGSFIYENTWNKLKPYATEIPDTSLSSYGSYENLYSIPNNQETEKILKAVGKKKNSI